MWDKAPTQIYWFTNRRGRGHGDPAANAVRGWVSDQEPVGGDVTQVVKYVPEPVWLPISTAPRDGRVVLLRNAMGHAVSGWYSERAGGFLPEVLLDDAEHADAWRFTHWMPRLGDAKC